MPFNEDLVCLTFCCWSKYSHSQPLLLGLWSYQEVRIYIGNKIFAVLEVEILSTNSVIYYKHKQVL